MEGYPLQGYVNYSSLTSNQSMCDSMNDPMAILTQPLPKKPWENLFKMREDLINHMKEGYIVSEEGESPLNGLSNLFIQFMKDFKEQKQKMEEAESNLQECITQTQKNVQVLTSFIEFLSKISEQTDKEITPLQTQIVEISKDISNECNIQEFKDIYKQEKIKYHQHLNVIRLINQMNIGSTCSICLQDNVDSYFNPCGHTACSKCCSSNGEYGNPCPLCRTDILSVNKLYFT